MSDTKNDRKGTNWENYIKELIASMESGKSSGEGKGKFHEVLLRMDKEYPSLMEQYPNKWVAVGKDGVLAVADSMEEVFAEVESSGLSGSEFEVEFFDSNPPDLIL